MTKIQPKWRGYSVVFKFEDLPSMLKERHVIIDDSGRSIDPEELTVTWVDDGSGWSIDKITARGRLWRKTGGLGEARTITIPRITLLHPEIRDAIQAQVPTPEKRD